MKAEGADSGKVEDADTIAIDLERVMVPKMLRERREYNCSAIVDG